MHKLTDASFTIQDEEGKTQTVKGGLFLDASGDAVAGANADSVLGNVVFKTAPADSGDQSKK
jgi:hypothetical protein